MIRAVAVASWLAGWALCLVLLGYVAVCVAAGMAKGAVLLGRWLGTMRARLVLWRHP